MAPKQSFEDSINRLEEIVRELEEGQVPLEDSIRLYEEGMKLGKKCKQILEAADRRITQLSAGLDREESSE
ncbi:MAG: exodeoxyribonuclease VII small subunit [Candidatus Krumholzibacteriota bacterium]|nr:exodeoxyribonuclease VII small subunit [Candidatus Krumholzibacteriota bacterium]